MIYKDEKDLDVIMCRRPSRRKSLISLKILQILILKKIGPLSINAVLSIFNS
jgi:hypothetical protein